MPRKGLAGPLTNMYTGLGMTVSMIDKQCGMAIVESAEDCAQAWEDLAKTNPKVRRALLMLLETYDEIGRTSCRDRVGKSVKIQVVGVTLKKKQLSNRKQVQY